MKRILCVVSGGDAPGLHNALYQIAKLAAQHGQETWGVKGGFAGLLTERVTPFNVQTMMPWLAMSGSYYASSREPVLAQPQARDTLQKIWASYSMDAMILFGGDGTLRYIPPLLESWGIPCIGIPTTIDNDVNGSDLTLGFDSAANFAYPIIDGIRATGNALPGRIFTLETLGGDTGYLALEVAHGANADCVLLPEYAYDSDHIATLLQSAIARQGQALLVYSEGVKDKDALLDFIPEKTGIRIRATKLGHAQRGGTPTHRDRSLATEMSTLAYQALLNNVGCGVAVVRHGKTVLHEGTLATQTPKKPDFELYQTINS